MPARTPSAVRYSIAFAVLIAALVAVRLVMPPAPPVSPAVPPTTAVAATQPATAPAAPDQLSATQPLPPPETLLDVIRDEQPDYPTKEPLDLPADLPDAARVELNSPVYLDGVGNLWISHPRGPSVADVLKKPLPGRTIVVREKIACVSWPIDADTPDIVTREKTGVYMLFPHASGDAKTPPQPVAITAVNFSQAIRFGDDLYFADSDRVRKISTGPNVPQSVGPVAQLLPTGGNIVFAESNDTLFAWQPWDESGHGGTAVSIDLSGKVTPLTAETGWADLVIQLVPLADGAVLIVSRGDDGSLQLKMKGAPNPIAFTPEQKTSIDTLARQMANRDPLVREKATRELEALGPTVFPELEALRDRLPPEAQVRIETLLGERFAPTLAGLKPLEGETRTIARFAGGGCVLQLMGGGTATDGGGGADQTVIPAYIAIRPGRFVQRLDLSAVANFNPAQYKLQCAGDEWVIVDPTDGPKRWIGNKTFALVDPPLKDYDLLVGIDASRRWIFKSTKKPGKTLIIDPALPDTTPRLPTWTVDGTDSCGWTNTNWPAVKRGEQVFVLGENGWRVPEKDETLDTKPPAATQPAFPYTITLAPGSTPFVLGNLVLIVNADNTVTRYRPAHDSVYVGKPEMVFKDGLPRDTPRRVWIDPANRLVFAGDQLTVTFPLGRIPKGIGDIMLRSAR